MNKGSSCAALRKTEVMEFDTPDIERFIYNWFAHNEDAADGYLTKELIGELQRNPRFMELAGNPLLLLLITYHYERERQLPRLRAELYRHCIRTRITKWNTVRGTHRGRFGEDDKWRLLRELALHIFQQEKKGLLLLSDLRDWVREFSAGLQLPEGSDPAVLLDEVITTSGLIQEWAIDRYGFSHQTLQEFFAAEAADRPGTDRGAALLETHLEQPAWREVILLYSGLTDNAANLLQRIVSKAQREGSKPELWLLAGRCLAEGARQVPSELHREVTEMLVEFLLEVHALSADEREETIANLKQFAADLLPSIVQNLIDGGVHEGWLLAERLLPPNAAVALREKVTTRLTELVSVPVTGSLEIKLDDALVSATGTVFQPQIETAQVQQAAIGALGRLGVSSEAGLAVLLQALQAPELGSRVEAVLALGRLAPEILNQESLDSLLTLYRGDRDPVRHVALEALLALGQQAAVGMVLVPAGEFLMGSRDDDRQAEKSEKPQHRFYLPAYYIDKTPVTNAEFGRFMAAGGYANSAYWAEAIAAKRWIDGQFVYSNEKYAQPRYWEDKKWNQPEQPVVGVSWYEALAYARWAGKRLPTEAEWEKAARGSDGLLYPWGNTWDKGRANTEEANLKQTTPVTQYAGKGDSPYGALDMAGNVWEWCSTRWWNENQKEYGYPYTPDDGREELEGGDTIVRVLRGGSWASEQERARCAARLRDYPGDWSLNGGFRCCATSSLSPGTGS